MIADRIREDVADDGLKAGISKLLLELETARRQRDKAMREADKAKTLADHYKAQLHRQQKLNSRLVQAMTRPKQCRKSSSDQFPLTLQ